MDAQTYLDMLREDGPEDYNASADSNLKGGGLKNHLHEDNKPHHNTHKDHKPDKNPYSNEMLEKFIKGVGFNVDDVPRFTEMAKKLNLPIVHEPAKKDLTSLDNHDTIEDVAHFNKDGKDLEIRKQALKRLIAKYKG